MFIMYAFFSLYNLNSIYAFPLHSSIEYDMEERERDRQQKSANARAWLRIVAIFISHNKGGFFNKDR